MATKRKKTRPKRLVEGKRPCLGLNANGSFNDSSQRFSGYEGLQNECTSVKVNQWPKAKQEKQDDESIEDIPQSHHCFGFSERKKFLKIPLEKAVNKVDYISNAIHGPLVGKLQFKVGMDGSGVGKTRTSSISTNVNFSGNMFLIADEEMSKKSNYDLEVEIAEGQVAPYPYVKTCDKLFKTVLSGTLMHCRNIMKSLEFLTRKQHSKLILCLDSDDLGNFDILVELVPSLQSDVNALVDEPTRRTPSHNCKTLMEHFYGQELNNVDELFLAKQEFSYNGEEIQNLYEFIMKYHNQKFSTTASMISEENNDSGISVSSATINGNKDSSGNVLEAISDADLKMDCWSDGSNFSPDYSDEMECDDVVKRENQSLSHQSLLPSLRPYQQAALKWMIRKENEEEYEKDDPNHHALGTKLSTIDGKTIYYNKFSGRFTSKIQTYPLPRGGILADEMGLGKSVEILALLLSNPREQKFAAERALEVKKELTDEQNEIKSSILLVDKHIIQSTLERNALDQYQNRKDESLELSLKPEMIENNPLAPCQDQSTCDQNLKTGYQNSNECDQSKNKCEQNPKTCDQGSFQPRQNLNEPFQNPDGNREDTHFCDQNTTDLNQDMKGNDQKLIACDQNTNTCDQEPSACDQNPNEVDMNPTVLNQYQNDNDQLALVVHQNSRLIDESLLVMQNQNDHDHNHLKKWHNNQDLETHDQCDILGDQNLKIPDPNQNASDQILSAVEQNKRYINHNPNSCDQNLNACDQDLNACNQNSNACDQNPNACDQNLNACGQNSNTCDQNQNVSDPNQNARDLHLNAFDQNPNGHDLNALTLEEKANKSDQNPKVYEQAPEDCSKYPMAVDQNPMAIVQNLKVTGYSPTSQNLYPKVHDLNGVSHEPVVLIEKEMKLDDKPEVVKVAQCGLCQNRIMSCDVFVSCCECELAMHFKCAGTQGQALKEYYCIECSSKKVIETHCTLIVSPETIVNQWIDEIKRHIKHGAIKYMQYQGVAKEGFLQPSIVAEHDIIITTFAVLRADFFHVTAEEGKSRSLRHRKKHAIIPSPLMSLCFWRICLDEAQMIQCTTTRTAEMALRIKAVHRWCVTGTPVQKGLEDIYGMLLFLGVFPYYMKTWWRKLLLEPLIGGNNKPLFELLSRVMWRTEKKYVLHQINLPKQTEQLNHLKFSPVERHFYQKQEEVCMANSIKEIRKWDETDTTLNQLDKPTLHKLLGPLLCLRQACCHPHIVRGGILSIQKSHLSMERLLERLIANAKLECVETHRQLMCALNGLAAIDIIQYKIYDAVKVYKEAIQSWAAHEDMFKTDTLQKLHTLKNMAECITRNWNGSLNSGINSDDASDRDGYENASLFNSCIKPSIEELTRDYMKRICVRVSAAQQSLEVMDANLRKCKDSVDWGNPWWIRVLAHYQESSEEGQIEFVRKFKSDLASQRSFPDSIRHKFTTIDGLKYIITSKLDSAMDSRQKVLEGVETLKGEPSKETIIATAECCLRPTENSGAPRCIFCKVDDLFAEYESKIFSGVIKNKVDETTRLGGLRHDTELDIVFRMIHVMTRQCYFDGEIREEGRVHLNYMDLLKQEFKCLKQVWLALHQRISAYDELEMSAIRLRLRYHGEETNEKYVIGQHEIKQQRLKHQSDKLIAENELRRKKGQLFYLKNLEKTQETENGSNPELCPICTKVLGYEWAVFTCGHCFCCDCAYFLKRQNVGHFSSVRKDVKVKCAICRSTTMAEDISYVMKDEDKNMDSADVNVKGRYSVKVEAVVRKILEIGQMDPEGKIIVFSTWCEILDIISQALTENDIIHRNGGKSKKAFHAGLVDFKTMNAVKVILLPLKLGSKGLNIIEATHVILVEPTLNPANEHQAIGRVHRIGQTKPTFVHRFLVKKTVEERIFRLLEKKCSTSSVSDEGNGALADVSIADVSTLLSDNGCCAITEKDV